MALSLVAGYASDASDDDAFSPDCAPQPAPTLPLTSSLSVQSEDTRTGVSDASNAHFPSKADEDPTTALNDFSNPPHAAKLGEPSAPQSASVSNRPIPKMRTGESALPLVENNKLQKKTRNKARHQPKQRKARQIPDDMPADFARELARGGYELEDVSFVDVDAAAESSLPQKDSSKPQASAVLAKARRIASRAGVSKEERRRHQITSLAADALALQAARRSMGATDSANSEKTKRR